MVMNVGVQSMRKMSVCNLSGGGRCTIDELVIDELVIDVWRSMSGDRRVKIDEVEIN